MISGRMAIHLPVLPIGSVSQDRLRLGCIDLLLANLWLCFLSLYKGEGVVVSAGIGVDVTAAAADLRAPGGPTSPPVNVTAVTLSI